MLRMHVNVDVDMVEGLLEIDGALGIPNDALYNRGAVAVSENFLSQQHEDNRTERIHAQMMSELNEVCDTESQSSKCKRPLENADSSRSRKSSKSEDVTSVRMGDDITSVTGCELSHSFKSQRARPKHLCQECGKTFKRAHNLKIHGRLHSGDKPYRCPFPDCSKEFRWKSSIVSHMNWHRTKKGDVLPGNFAGMHALILKKESGVEMKRQEAKEEARPVEEMITAEYEVNDQKDEQEQDIGRNDNEGEVTQMADMGDMSSFTTGLGEVELPYPEEVKRDEKDDSTVVTPSTDSYQASPVAMEMGELDCLPVLDEKEWETRSEGCRSGLSSVLLPSLSCCRIENDDGFGSFLEEN